MRNHRWTAAAAVLAATAVLWTMPAAQATNSRGVTSYPPPAGTNGPFGITQGPGGTWYGQGNQIVRVGPGGHTDIFPLPDATANAGWLTWAGGEKVWFADRNDNKIGTVDPRGRVNEWTLPPSPDGGIGPGGIVVTGRWVWFTDPGGTRIGRLDSHTGNFTMYAVPTADSWPLGLTLGPDGALWFTERSADQVGRMTLTGHFTEWALTPGAFPNRIVVGPDHQLWFTELNTSMIGRITVHGTLTETPITGGPVGITVGPDNRLYVALYTSSQLGRLDSRGQLSRTWDVPGALLVAASRGRLWVTNQFTNSVVAIRTGCPGR